MTTTHTNGLSVLAFDGARLAFPLTDVVGAQRASQLERSEDLPPLALGTIEYAGRRWPVFGLGRDYALLSELPENCGYCACLSADGSETGLALACETIGSIPIGTDEQPAEVPISVQRPDSPMERWHLHGERILPISSTPALMRYISRLMEKHHD